MLIYVDARKSQVLIQLDDRVTSQPQERRRSTKFIGRLIVLATLLHGPSQHCLRSTRISVVFYPTATELESNPPKVRFFYPLPLPVET